MRKKKNQIKEEALYIREGEEPREKIREKEEPGGKKKQTNKQTRSEKRPFKSEKGKNPRKKKKIRNRKREKIKTGVGGFEVSAWAMGGWVGFRSE